MDYIFNKLIPVSSENIIIIEPIAKTFINGLARKYNDNYPKQLEHHIDKERYFKAISEINALLATFWPCIPALSIGYVFSCFSCGFSFCIPYLCIKDAESMIYRLIEQQNKEIFKPRGLEISLEKSCSTSWIRIKITNSYEMEGISIQSHQDDNNTLL